MLSTRWNSLFSITATTVFIIIILHISPVLANNRTPFPISNNSFLFDSNLVADNSVAATKQNPSHLLHQLNLTSKQREEMKKIHHQYKQQIRKKKSSLTLLQQELSDLMIGTESVELIRAKNRQLVNLRTEIGELRFESMLATREILTPQQRQKFREIIESQLTQ